MSFNARIGDIADVVMGQSPQAEDVNSAGTGFPLLNGPTEFTTRCPVPVQYTTAGKKFAENGDILFCVRGSTTGRMNYADQKYVIGRGIAAICGKNGYPTQYVRAVIERNLDRLLATATGSTFPNIGRDQLLNFEVETVSPEDAIEINKLIVSLEDKIELNRQINQTLEQIAQTIFNSWFVDFEPVKAKIAAKAAGCDPKRAAMCAISGKLEPELDQLTPEQYQQLAATAALFPDELVESELGLIPVGWSVVTLDSLSAKISKGTTPTKQDIGSAVDVAEIPFIKVKDIGEDGELARDGIEKIPDSVHRGALKRSILNKDDILFSIAGTIGRIAVVEKDLHNSNANQAVAFVRLRDSDAHLGLCLQHLKSQRLQDAANAAIVQGVQANLSLGSLGGFKIILPCKNVLAEWNNKYHSLFDETRCLAGETRTLTTLRDTLLPKLLSGDISLAEK